MHEQSTASHHHGHSTVMTVLLNYWINHLVLETPEMLTNREITWYFQEIGATSVVYGKHIFIT